MKLKLKKCKNFINGYLKLINGRLKYKTKMKTKITKMKITKMSKTKMYKTKSKTKFKQLILILILS